MLKLNEIKKMLIIVSCLFGCTSVSYKETDLILPMKGDGYIFLEQLKHFKESHLIRVNKDTLRLFLETRANDVEQVHLTYKTDADSKEKTAVMESVGDLNGQEYFYIDISAKFKNISYYFVINDASYSYYFGTKSSDKKKEVTGFEYTLIEQNTTESVEEQLQHPKWVDSAIWYQLMVDRFRNGDPLNDPIFNQLGSSMFKEPKSRYTDEPLLVNALTAGSWDVDGKIIGYEYSNKVWCSDWNELEGWEKAYQNKEHNWYKMYFRHYGGDILGILEKLPYLSKLSINALWMSPVFYSHSNHKYDALDLRHISPDFGVIIQTGENYGIAVKAENGYGKNYVSRPNESEYRLLEIAEFNDTNALNESLDPNSWCWTESDIIFAKLISEAHKKAIRVVIDLPLDYTSRDFFAFKNAIVEGPGSKYASWYRFSDWNKVDNYSEENIDVWNPLVPYSDESNVAIIILNNKKYRRKWIQIADYSDMETVKELIKWNISNVAYECFDKGGILPLLNVEDKAVQDYLINSALKWVVGPDGTAVNNGDLANDDGVDGFNVDILDINKFNIKFWNKFRAELKKVKNDIFLGSNILVAGKGLNNLRDVVSDSTVNYSFFLPIVNFMLDKRLDNTKEAAATRIKNFVTAEKLNFLTYEDSHKRRLRNVLSTIDTDRIFSALINPEKRLSSENRIQENGQYYDIRPDLFSKSTIGYFKLAALMQLTYIGGPVICYGDEKGMWGASDPFSRKPMLWSDLEPYDMSNDQLDKYKEEVIKGSEAIADTANSLIRYENSINREIWEWYKLIVKIRSEHAALFSKGDLKYSDIEELKGKDVICYEVKLGKEIVVILINFSNNSIELDLPVTAGKSFTDLLFKPVKPESKPDKINAFFGKLKSVKVGALSAKVLYSSY